MSPSDLPTIRRQVDRFSSQKQNFLENLAREQQALAKAESQVADALAAQSILQKVAQGIQQAAHHQIARIVSRCLSSVFGEEIRLSIQFEQRRGKTEADFTLHQAGHQVDPRLGSGGVLEVTALALRLCSLVLSQPPARKLLVLDEPFVGLSATNLPRMAKLIEALSQELGVQCIIATHSQELEIGKVVTLDTRSGDHGS